MLLFVPDARTSSNLSTKEDHTWPEVSLFMSTLVLLANNQAEVFFSSESSTKSTTAPSAFRTLRQNVPAGQLQRRLRPAADDKLSQS
jgi:hypothetical protein